MPKYSFKLTNGKTMDLDGDSQPSDEEVEALAKENGVELALADTPEPTQLSDGNTVSVSPMSAPVSAEPPKKGWLSSAWDTLTEPLTTAPSELASGIANRIDTPDADSTGSFWDINKARLKGFAAGATEGVGDVVSSLSSPLSLATIGLGGAEAAAAKSGMRSVAKLANIGQRMASIPDVASGAEDIYEGNYGRGLTELALGAAGMASPAARVETTLADAAPAPKSKVLSKDPNLNAGVGDPLLAGSVKPTRTTGAIAAKAAEMPMGTVVTIKSDVMTPETYKKAIEHGFEFDSVDDQGHFRLKKTKDAGQKTPILEGEVGNVRGIPKEEKLSNITEAMNLPRAMMTTMDFSAPLRQGFGLMHKKAFWTALPDMVKSFGSKEFYDASQAAINEKPLFKMRKGVDPSTGTVKRFPSFAQDAGLALSDIGIQNQREEVFMSRLAEKIPGFGKLAQRSNRAYTSFLNKLRADTFEDLVQNSNVFFSEGGKQKVDMAIAKDLAGFVNNSTGRGNLGALEKHAASLNATLFSPRLMASRLQMLNPRNYITGSPAARKEYLKSFLAMATIGNTVTGLTKLSGVGDVGKDPNSSDFGKIKIGNTRIDPWAGFQQYGVAANRLLRPSWASAEGMGMHIPDNSGIAPLDDIAGVMNEGGQRVTSSTSGKEFDLWAPKTPFEPNWGSTAWRFVKGKTNPVIAFALALADNAKEMDGTKMNFSTANPMENAVTQRFVPLIMQDLYELTEADPKLAAVLAPFMIAGMGSQTYGAKQ